MIFKIKPLSGPMSWQRVSKKSCPQEETSGVGVAFPTCKQVRAPAGMTTNVRLNPLLTPRLLRWRCAKALVCRWTSVVSGARAQTYAGNLNRSLPVVPVRPNDKQFNVIAFFLVFVFVS